MNIVIGSGPAGVAAAAALVRQGAPVTMLDAGGDLEADARQVVDRLAASPPEHWNAGDVRRLRGPLRYNPEGAPLKLAFGSDYPYRDVDRLQPVDATGVDAYRALATGGLSTLWGATVLPFTAADLSGWPLSEARMRAHYETALQLTGLAGRDDALSALYPLLVPPTELEPSAQAQSVATRADAHASVLARQNVYVGRARLAVAQPGPAGGGCRYCGLCLYGCPWDLIYSAATTLRAELLAEPSFRHVQGVLVRRLSEDGGTVRVAAVSRDTGTPREFEATRVYLAAGAIGSTTILLASLGATGRPILLRQSDHFLLLLWLQESMRGVSDAPLHTLSQLFIEILDQSVSSHGVHLQLYTYNDFYPRMARDRLGALYPMLAPLVTRALERIAVIKGYLHSDESAAIRAVLDAGPEPATLRLEPVPSSRAAGTVRRVEALLRRNRRRLGAAPIPFARRMGRPGSSVHVGGSFPMRRSPAEFESDVLGRPSGFERVHVVDSTVFPTLPAAPPTLTAMANAIRIARETAPGH
jgi:choline dehydrogenase-like flavoprotein